MFASYLKTVLRNLAKNKLYAAINILGLAIGLSVFLLSILLTDYETNHDHMFSERDRIYTVGAVFHPSANIGVLETDAVQSAMGPIIKAQIGELEAVARTILREYLVTVGADSFYQDIRFADAEFTKIFDFDYIHGDDRVLNDPSSLLLTESAAMKYFGRTDVIGETLELDHKHSLSVGAVVKDIARDSHFNSGFIESATLEFVAPFTALHRITDYPMEGEWNNLSFGNLTYMLLPESMSAESLQQGIDAIYEEHVSEDRKTEFLSAYKTRSLVEANTSIQDAIGMPLVDTIRILGLLVLIVACVNYTNLATAQSFSRTREVGLRKTFGADRKQLLIQFLVESTAIAFIALVIAVAALEVIIPWYNLLTSKVVALNYLQSGPALVGCALAVGLVAGAYPAYLITGVRAIDTLKNTLPSGRSGGLFRSAMIGVQFAISTFMLAMVMIMVLQNEKIQESSSIYPREQMLILERLGISDIQGSHEALKERMLRIEGVEQFSFSSHVPFEQSNNSFPASAISGDHASKFSINRISIDIDFFENYGIQLLAGRNLSLDYSNDEKKEDSLSINVVLNELAVTRLNLGSADEAVGKKFYNVLSETPLEAKRYEFTVVGVVESQNFLGLHNKIKPMVFLMEREDHSRASLKVSGNQLLRTLESIDDVWNEVIPEYPIQRRFLNDIFEEVFVMMRTMTNVLLGFAAVALSLALIGLFGLAAYMAEQRTKEIGIRKVLGAKISQITYLLIWQFSIPVIWSLLAAIPAAYFAGLAYLNFYAERIDNVAPVLLLASLVGVVTAWLIVTVHALKVARCAPIKSLRYE